MNFLSKKLKPEKYLGLFILGFIVFSLFYLPYLLFLKGMGEYKSIPDIVEQQLAAIKHHKKVIYGSGIRPMNYFYKKELMEHIHPQIIAWGSSRVMQFRQKMFLSKFVNLGGMMTSLDAGLRSYKDIIRAKPKLVLLGIDFWWFNENFQNKNYKETIAPKLYKPKSSDLLTVRDWLKNGKLTYTDFLKGVLQFPNKGIGVSGILHEEGFGPDGSYYYTGIITGQKQHHDIGFADTLLRIKTGERRFQYGETLSKAHFKEFMFLLDEFQRQHIEVILFFPPLAAASNRMINHLSEKYSYIPQLKKALKAAGYHYYDYSEPGLIQSSDCEFIDGFHGGDVTYARILKDLAKQEPELAKYVDMNFLEKSIAQYSGFAYIPDGQFIPGEIDFLEIGCSKGNPQKTTA
ncbi:hypothetical protein OQJ15_12975 [Fluoribacter dumoffii]|uniref:Uncharacterized protein n=2 Tax=Fluoribacter dumoffii TaxID=463 RepID=A0A377G5P6_9GAMM|nr:hypothetical protein [Fluoribacter dumoffii]KTC91660.1 hypothetical protein Ldum_2728 [Fluoribacter dumoffii NY 23]MCW8387215.1 hypothetical protein [Fluoribacter dumoffii]MCW8497419.1 hypothetical protein [Fluoribacter dumoffii]STO20127.1 Uncharacterised protein [Fluoribacter dumoffii]